MPGLSYLGGLTIAQLVPSLADASSRITASVGTVLPAVKAQVAGITKFATTPPSVSAGANAAISGAASLKAQVAAGRPGVTVSVGMITGILGRLTATIGALNAHLAAAASLSAALGAAGVQAYTYGGAVGQLGAALTAQTGSGFPGGGGANAACNGLLIVTQASAAWAAMGVTFGIGSTAGLSYLGSLSLGQCIPLNVTAAAAVTASVTAALPQIQLQFAAFTQMSLQIGFAPPSITANIAAATKLIGQLSLAVSVATPSAAVSISLLANLSLTLAQLTAQLSVTLGFPLAVGGINAYAYTGPSSGFGSAIASAFADGLPDGGGPSAPCNALLLATESPATWAAMQATLKTS